MNLTQFIYRNTIYFFVGILLLSIVVFGGQYLLRLSEGEARYFPLETFHAITAGLWCLLLVGQAYLIRRQRLAMHRAFGKVAFLIAPLMAFSILWISLDVLRYDGIQDSSLYILSVRVFLFIYYAGFLVASLANVRRPDVHARWMICSAAVLLDPIISRISAFVHPVPATTGFHQAVAFGVMDLLILILAAADWRQGRVGIFLVALVLMLVGQTIALTTWETPAFRSFAELFATLPLPLGY